MKNKTQTQIIKETIGELTKINANALMIMKPQFTRKFNYHQFISDYDEKHEFTLDLFDYIDDKTMNLIFKLNNLLDKSEQDERLLQIEAEMIKLKHKEIINVKEFSEKYGYSKTKQQSLRERISNNPLPYRQEGLGTKITYKISEIEKWFDNELQSSGKLGQMPVYDLKRPK